MKKSMVVGISLFVGVLTVSSIVHAKRARTPVEAGKTNKAVEAANKHAAELSVRADKGVKTDIVSFDKSRSVERNGRKMSAREIERENEAIEIYEAMGKEGNELAADMVRIMTANKSASKEDALEPESLANFIAIAEKMKFQLIRQEKQLKAKFKELGLDAEKIRGCTI